MLAIIAPTMVSCSGNDDDDLVGNWVKLGDFSGSPRTSATGTTLNDLGYIGLGYNYTQDERLSDFWTYDADRNTWDQIADFPGNARTNAVSFAADGKLYVGSGFDGTSGERLKDFWEYNPTTNQWTEIAELQSDNVNSPNVDGREGMTAFSINGVGYVLGGSDADGTAYKDMYAYDPAIGSWSKKADFGGSKRANAVAFVIGDYAYVCTGISNGSYPNDFYRYDAVQDRWEELRKISDNSDDSYDDDYDIIRTNAVAFTADGKGYIATGGRGSSGSDVWEYDPTTDLWTEKTSFEGSSRYNAVAFTIDGVGYVLTGQQGTTSNFDDMFRFDPNAEYEEND
ncbi:kelch repeat-containing protein [Mangrovibacterium marinum]|uniref:Kelch motif protein n=1 Tax=Mangrovibacterium marinum TaxID=1639118 RepID=A0A2T5C3N6_9BACT|nr:kelch repeat-containing protein [Mangrovibacterium marinum]PTN09349.1 Kelch motif protein [Mangrovibacterium marinum]